MKNLYLKDRDFSAPFLIGIILLHRQHLQITFSPQKMYRVVQKVSHSVSDLERPGIPGSDKNSNLAVIGASRGGGPLPLALIWIP